MTLSPKEEDIFCWLKIVLGSKCLSDFCRRRDFLEELKKTSSDCDDLHYPKHGEPAYLDYELKDPSSLRIWDKVYPGSSCQFDLGTF